MKKFWKPLATAFLGSLLLTSPAQAETLRLVLTGDIYELDSDKGRGGMAKLATVVEQQRASGDTVMFVHAGDTFSPSLLSGFVKGKQMVEMFNAMNLDLMVLGNHEWDFGPEVLRERIKEANFPIMATNVREGNGHPIEGTLLTHMVEVGEHKIGFMGLVTPNTKEISSPGDMTFAPQLETAKAVAKDLRDQGANLVIVLAHLDYLEDMEIVNSGVVDAVLSGHDHYKITWDNGKTVWMESGEEAENVAVMTIDMETVVDGDKKSFEWEASMQMIDTKNVHSDRYIAGLTKGYEDFLSNLLDVEIGNTAVEVDSRRPSVRSKETVMGNVIADAMRADVGADVAITNGGGIRGNKVYPEGTMLTRRDIVAELPFGNKTVKISLTGKQIKEALENGVSQVENGAGRFPQVSGLKFVWNPKGDVGNRVEMVEIGGNPLNENQTYSLATNDYMGRGGDGYSMFKNAERLVNESGARLMATVTADYIQQQGGLKGTLEGRIQSK
ncbi:MAG: bifunctional metallophosphatase/5'-nucleotidase [bacterium]